MNNKENKYDLIKFEDGDFSLDVNVSPNEDTVWLNREQLALLFGRDIKTISKHINNSLKEECINSTVAKFATVQIEGNRQVTREIEYFNLDVITSIGYRVKSFRGVKFRQWANRILKQYLLKGSVINEERCLSCTSNIISLQNKVESIESKINNIQNDIYSDNSKAFFEGEIVEPYTFIRHIFFLAKENLTITDFYADNYLISMLKDIKVNITIVTSSSSYLNKIVLPNNINVVYDNDIHGRYIFIDDKYVYALDNSFNNIGKKKFVIMKLDNITKEMLLQGRKAGK
ncbi:MAG: virulence RhuM family protein [Acholeplasmatales bacterium]|nr:virulence RhuM family protein [Acholeplasmatales bacterium]